MLEFLSGSLSLTPQQPLRSPQSGRPLCDTSTKNPYDRCVAGSESLSFLFAPRVTPTFVLLTLTSPWADIGPPLRGYFGDGTDGGGSLRLFAGRTSAECPRNGEGFPSDFMPLVLESIPRKFNQIIGQCHFGAIACESGGSRRECSFTATNPE